MNSGKIGEVVVKLRKEKGFSQEKLALEVGISRKGMHLIEAGKGEPKLESIEKICLALGVTVSDFFKLVEEK
ncbi:MAG: helix-turn-helix domain-containing protein [Acholeplasmatales bacterium]|nr:helix-turn-helix domain-containing protein [Acholeplasmatales bacterium]